MGVHSTTAGERGCRNLALASLPSHRTALIDSFAPDNPLYNASQSPQVNSVKKGVRFRAPEVTAGLQRLELAREHLAVRWLAGRGQPPVHACMDLGGSPSLMWARVACMCPTRRPTPQNTLPPPLPPARPSPHRAGGLRQGVAAVPGGIWRLLPALPRGGAGAGSARLPHLPGCRRVQRRVRRGWGREQGTAVHGPLLVAPEPRAPRCICPCCLSHAHTAPPSGRLSVSLCSYTRPEFVEEGEPPQLHIEAVRRRIWTRPCGPDPTHVQSCT